MKTTLSQTAQAGSQEDSYFTADGHQAILNKMNKKPKRNRKWTNTNNWNKLQKKHRLGPVRNKILVDLNRFYVYTTLSLGSSVIHKHTKY